MTLAGRAPGTVACDVRVIGVKWDLTSQVFVCMSLLTSSNGKKSGVVGKGRRGWLEVISRTISCTFSPSAFQIIFGFRLPSVLPSTVKPTLPVLYPCYLPTPTSGMLIVPKKARK